ncbi:MAG: RsmB/NOP family class I SAM-dependent RNA methyltransferase [Candidatus Bathyarchaeota archaeon]|nr:RsmB/NOP family class I SAM-dependent RNA methyltransferase [Candidatus Bathyarchaeota archaeon]
MLLKDTWTVAIETLSWIELQKLSARLALARTVKQLGLRNPHAIRYAYGLVIETVRRKNLIDKFLNSVLKPVEINEFNMGVQAFLRLYVYQTRIAKGRAEIDLKEAERIAKLGRAILGWKTLIEVEPILGFLLTRRLDSVLKAASAEEKLGLQTFHPTWFVKYCINLLGRSEAISFLEGDVNPPPICIRVNTLKQSEKAVLETLESEGVRLEKTELLKHVYKVMAAKQLLRGTTSFREGLFYIQDKASCFAAEVADAKPEVMVLDVCAAPGAKTTYLAQFMQNRGCIWSLDYSLRRMQTWRREVARMGVKIAEPVLADVCVSLPLAVKADVVVLDPPCTSTGVFAKQPSAKWRLTQRSIDRMAEIQWRMINNCAEQVKAGGVLTYSTCSITIEENEMIIERFLKQHPEFSLADISPKLGIPGLRGLHKCQRLYPHIHESNGFFIAKLLKQHKVEN